MEEMKRTRRDVISIDRLLIIVIVVLLSHCEEKKRNNIWNLLGEGKSWETSTIEK